MSPASAHVLAEKSFDLVIVGGGITGAALAYAAVHARRPLRVALVERGALAAGTSSRSSGLLHGGLRYLGQGRIGLVRQLLRGRRAFARLAPHLCARAPFLLPWDKETRHQPWLLQMSLALYGLCDRGPRPAGLTLPRARRLDAAAARAAEPLLHDGCLGAFGYDELSVKDAALVEALAAGAAAAGAIVVTHTRCDGLERKGERITGVWLRECGPAGVQSARFHVGARIVVDATGPWSGSLERKASREPVRLRLSRGSHIVVPHARLPLSHTVVCFARDGRALFASPRGSEVLVGATETEHSGPPDDASPTQDEINQLLGAMQASFPDAKLHDSDIVRSFAGVRPLARPGGADISRLDRGYLLDWPGPNLLALRGGKLTLALQAARLALRAIGDRAGALGVDPPDPRSDETLPVLAAPSIGAGAADREVIVPGHRSPRRAA